MKLKKVLASTLAAVTVLSSVALVNAEETITLTLWGAEEDQTLLGELAEEFKAAYPDVTFDIQIGVESESTAKDTILTDVEAAADVYAFASDQIYDLVNAGALIDLDEYAEALTMAGKTLDDVKAANVAGSIEAATVNGKLYAFPRAADNGYFLYYDSNVLSEEDVASWDSLLAAAEAAGKKVGMTLASGWYNASFFYGAGFTTGLNEDGTTTIDWNGTSADGYTGVDVVKGMLNIASSPAFMAIADGDISNQIAAGGLCAAVSGTWDAITAQEAFGDGYAATKLPTFTVGDTQVQQGSVAGYKFVGVNGYAENAGWAVLLADFITNEASQQKFFDQRESGPSNNNIIDSDAVKSNVAIAALAEQAEFGKTQTVGGKYWDPAQTFGELIAQGTLKADDDAGIQAALDTLVEGVTAPIE
ncbi:ABC transporter, solute-binding protein [Marvinbryantia formatexigens DSM 14469]|uniref:ABC transporter, solute-binding protein n=1 Tax=Marvinbryantia formatexigens DSM 14469 TaxID=478749 RepID=C6LAN7_9FIRM|nr:extracellular solute-binding protein [Marvinbryantia formatexigens]EET62644.1 ABC transporter, solute-binding protein [Marvinbryantia formatexigens DSM 14469]UWO23210.1 extracellular solute-binding protein [Marvinbryantia formatexigens DSM 14469]SDG59297.1 arabinogalactan oligomer / maltooligosaccharide transport system substrate-binding protein [Marvinbryantia formatexigens]